MICWGIGLVIFFITATLYPKPTDFDNITPVLLWLCGVVMGIGITFLFRNRNRKEIVKQN
jgi:hypothetical protein